MTHDRFLKDHPQTADNASANLTLTTRFGSLLQAILQEVPQVSMKCTKRWDLISKRPFWQDTTLVYWHTGRVVREKPIQWLELGYIYIPIIFTAIKLNNWGNLKTKSLLFLFTLEWSWNHTPPLSQPLGEIKSCPSSSGHRTTQFPHGSELLGNLSRKSEGSPQPNNDTKTPWTSSTRATCSRQINLSIYFFLYYLNY